MKTIETLQVLRCVVSELGVVGLHEASRVYVCVMSNIAKSNHPHPERACNQFSGQWTMCILCTHAILLSTDPVQHTQHRNNAVFPKMAGWFEWKLRDCLVEQWRLNNHSTGETDARRAADAQKMEFTVSIHPSITCMHTAHIQNIMQALTRSSRHINTCTHLLSVFKLTLYTPTICTYTCTNECLHEYTGMHSHGEAVCCSRIV